MSIDLTALDLRLRRRSIFFYALGMALYALIIVVLYPSFKNDTGLDELFSSNSTFGALFGIAGSLTSPSGWLNANLYANFLPLIVLMVTIGYGASCIAGQDEDGTLALIATLPVSRRWIALQKAAAMVALSLPVPIVTGLCVVVGRGFGLDVDLWNLVGTTVGVVLLGLAFGLLAMVVAAAGASRGAAIGVASAVAAASYLVSSLAPAINWLHSAKYASLFYYAVGDNQLDEGLSWLALAVLLATTVVLLVATVIAFDSRDIR
ncbi:ABC transporter permease subunit [Rhodococcus sp. NPDC059234]|uniref:ABC transporter permease subunit n=1 Tax=Rhodococcus sp. NPDC059234 TaxID=3346781 RepID=UPI00366C5333